MSGSIHSKTRFISRVIGREVEINTSGANNSRIEIHTLNQYVDEIKTLYITAEKRIGEMDAGNLQLLEKLLGVEQDLDGKLQGVTKDVNTLAIKLNPLDTDNKNNSQTIVNLQE